MSIEELPQYLYCPDCDNKHFLSINRDSHGGWSLGYVEYENGGTCCFVNNAKDLEEGAVRMMYSVERYKRSHSGKEKTSG